MPVITKPTLVLDKERCLANIRRMSLKAEKHHLLFRPHFKTHQSRIIGRWFRDAGVTRITVSSVTMARYFALDGWKDITIAFPVNLHELGMINELSQMATVNLLVSSGEKIETIGKQLAQNTGIFVEIDTGYGRSGINASFTDIIRDVIRKIRNTPHLEFSGLLSHTGNTYSAGKREEVLTIHDQALRQLINLRKELSDLAPEFIISIGDTPACCLSDNFSGIDEIRPGNFVFFDLMQVEIGSCTEEQVAVCAVCPVVARYPERNEAIIYGGAVHLSKEFMPGKKGERNYGSVVQWKENGWSSINRQAYLSSLSQEHGKITADAETIKQLEPGMLVGIIPVHSCLTADLMKGYITTTGEEIDHMSRYY